MVSGGSESWRGVCLVTERFCGISEVFGFSCACWVSEDARSPLPVRGRAAGAGKAATGPRSAPGRGSRRGWPPKWEHKAGLCDGKRPDPGSVAAGLPGFPTAGPGNPSLAARADSRSKFSFSRSLAGRPPHRPCSSSCCWQLCVSIGEDVAGSDEQPPPSALHSLL